MLKRFVPTRYHYFLSNLKNSLLNGYSHIHYSQFGEDIYVTKMFPKKDGIYVDVGAHHPKRYSNTYLLHKKGWRGVNIDPNPHTIALFNRARPKDVNLCTGIGNTEGELTYYQFSDPAVNTFSKLEADKWMGKDWITFLGTKKVRIQTLAHALSDISLDAPIDLLDIDTEGMDLEVLESNDWSVFVPKTIIVESSGFDAAEPHSHPIYQYLTKKGYALKAFIGPSLIFVLE